MFRRSFIILAFAAGSLSCDGEQLSAQDWMFDQSLYTNDPKTGKRVDQYQKIAPVYRIPFEQFFATDGPHPWEMLYPYWGGYNGFWNGPYGFPTMPYYLGLTPFF